MVAEHGNRSDVSELRAWIEVYLVVWVFLRQEDSDMTADEASSAGQHDAFRHVLILIHKLPVGHNTSKTMVCASRLRSVRVAVCGHLDWS